MYTTTASVIWIVTTPTVQTTFRMIVPLFLDEVIEDNPSAPRAYSGLTKRASSSRNWWNRPQSEGVGVSNSRKQTGHARRLEVECL